MISKRTGTIAFAVAFLLGIGSMFAANEAHNKAKPLARNFPQDSDFAKFAQQYPDYGWITPGAKDTRDIEREGMFAIFAPGDLNTIHWFASKDGKAMGTSQYSGEFFNP